MNLTSKSNDDIYIKEEMLFPNISLNLLKISNLCILFSSSAVEETIMCQVPAIDFHVDNIDNLKRLKFLYHKKAIQHVKDWKNINFDNFKNIYNKLAKKNDKIFKKIRNQYLFEKKNISQKIVNFIIENFKIIEIYSNNQLSILSKKTIPENKFLFIKEIFNLYLNRNPFYNEIFNYINLIEKNIFNEDIVLDYFKNLIHL